MTGRVMLNFFKPKPVKTQQKTSRQELMETLALTKAHGDTRREVMVRVFLLGDILDEARRAIDEIAGPLNLSPDTDLIYLKEHFPLEDAEDIEGFVELADKVSLMAGDGFDQALSLVKRFKALGYQ